MTNCLNERAHVLIILAVVVILIHDHVSAMLEIDLYP
jgi:hypothetical protein